jgi:hypothetical protein
MQVNSSLLTSDCSERCSCSPGSSLTCQAAGCPQDRVCEVQEGAKDCWSARGLCSLSVGANLTTFDGAHGTISSSGFYELSFRCPGLQNTVPWYRIVADVQACQDKVQVVGEVHIFFQDGLVTVTPSKGVWVSLGVVGADVSPWALSFLLCSTSWLPCCFPYPCLCSLVSGFVFVSIFQT